MTTTKPVLSVIKSIAELRELARGALFEGYIALNGNCRSSKCIVYFTGPRIRKPWKILNEIDGTYERMTEAEFATSFIADAIAKGAFVRTEW
jgi:hypothetical protein